MSAHVDLSSSTDLREMSIEVLKTLQSPILHKLESASIANLADVVFSYSTASNDMLSVP